MGGRRTIILDHKYLQDCQKINMNVIAIVSSIGNSQQGARFDPFLHFHRGAPQAATVNT